VAGDSEKLREFPRQIPKFVNARCGSRQIERSRATISDAKVFFLLTTGLYLLLTRLLTREKWIARSIQSPDTAGTEAALREVKEKRICERSRGICKLASPTTVSAIPSSYFSFPFPIIFQLCVNF